jgi:hypothetical protein
MFVEILGHVTLLKHWKRMPDAPPSEYSPFCGHHNRHHRFSEKEIADRKSDLKRMSPASYYSVFPEEEPRGR